MKTSKTFLAIFLIFSFGQCGLAQQQSTQATRIVEKISLDGKLTEVAWQSADTYTDFVKLSPNPGKAAEQQTFVQFIYDDEALYIGARMTETSLAEISKQVTERDAIGQADVLSFIVDTYNNATSAMEFVVTVSGTQYDAKWSDSGSDSDWDEVWESATSIEGTEWFCEMKIPYSALRFPKKDIQSWNFNMVRIQGKKGQRTSLFPVVPEGPEFLAQCKPLNGIENIKTPVRLSIYPYASTYLLHSKDVARTPLHSYGASYNAGLDIKYGINDAFTLQSTLIPDFGQVRADDQILNLSPFEIQFNENRSFFTEGTEIFNKANLFYSRRIGGRPVNQFGVFSQLGLNEVVEHNPSQAQLVNATKLSGRTNRGTGIGFFNAFERSSYASVKNLGTGEIRKIKTAPLTNYNVIVVDQNLPNNSSLSLINTNVQRFDDDFSDANVIGTDFTLKNKKQNYSLFGNGAYSYKKNGEYLKQGHKINLDAGKTAGNFRFMGGINFVSKDYDINDIGINFRTNQKNYASNLQYSFYEPFLVFNRMNTWANYNYTTTYIDNQFSSRHINTGFWTETKKQWQVNMWFNLRPQWNDFFEPRVQGRHLQNPGFVNAGIWASSDRRKKFYMSAFGFAANNFEKGRYIYEMGAGPNWVASSKLLLQADVSFTKSFGDVGWVNFRDTDIILGQRDQVTISNEFTVDYNFSKNHSFSSRFRHYWSSVYYNSYHELQEDGSLAITEYDRKEDANFNIFNMELNYRWRFAPGSDLFLVWKSNISGYNFDDATDFRQLNYLTGLEELKSNPQENSISLRAVYFLDYWRTKQAMARRS